MWRTQNSLFDREMKTPAYVSFRYFLPIFSNFSNFIQGLMCVSEKRVPKKLSLVVCTLWDGCSHSFIHFRLFISNKSSTHLFTIRWSFMKNNFFKHEKKNLAVPNIYSHFMHLIFKKSGDAGQHYVWGHYWYSFGVYCVRSSSTPPESRGKLVQ